MKAAVKRYCIEGYDILKNRNMQTALKKTSSRNDSRSILHEWQEYNSEVKEDP